jgi:hypothetical protein
MRVLVFLVGLTFPSGFSPVSERYVSAAQEGTVYICPIHREVQSSTPGNCPKCNAALIVEPVKKQETPAENYTCPMHLEVRTADPGKCPKCDMPLVPLEPGVSEDFNLVVDCSPGVIKPNQPVRLRFRVFNPKTGSQVKQFGLLHDKLFHLFVISQDMTEFQHIHPDPQPDGSFTIETVLPREGHYKIYSDFYPIDGAPQVLQGSLVTAGYKSDLFASQARLVPDKTFSQTVDGMKITLTLDPQKVIAGKPVTLKYHLVDAKTDQPVRDLKPYLAAWGHTLILSEDQADYVHSHPVEVVPPGADPKTLNGGPEVTFEALAPRPGAYRIWSQFLRGERLTTVAFTIQAEQLR